MTEAYALKSSKFIPTPQIILKYYMEKIMRSTTRLWIYILRVSLYKIPGIQFQRAPTMENRCFLQRGILNTSRIHMGKSEDIKPDYVSGCVEPSPWYSVLCQFPEENTSITTIYDQEMSYSQMVKPPKTTHNVSH